MIKIGLISDTHSYMDASILSYLKPCDEVWHIGDVGNATLIEQIQAQNKLRGVYGNIDGQDVRSIFPENLLFYCEEVKVLLTHIGGYPPKYNPRSRKLLNDAKPDLFISGHSHILKVIFDEKISCLHINPGAAGLQGWQKVRTLIRFCIDGKQIQQLEIIELGSRGKLV